MCVRWVFWGTVSTINDDFGARVMGIDYMLYSHSCKCTSLYRTAMAICHINCGRCIVIVQAGEMMSFRKA